MPKLYFQNKALTLQSLRGKLENANILPIEIISWSEFKHTSEHELISRFAHLGDNLIVRSSCSFEDSNLQSNAGAFLSVFANRHKEIKSSIHDVFLSYNEYLNDQEIVLVQPKLTDISHCGVLFTKVADSNAPYYVVENDSSGATDSVTSGSQIVDTFYIRRNLEIYSNHEFYSPIIKLANELEVFFENQSLDLEYAIDNKKQLWLLQVRPLIVNKNNTTSCIDITQIINKAKCHFTNLSSPSPIIHGKKSIFGIMPDWNPAEIIGIKPKPLSLSLYKELVTDSTWAYQRDNYGYKNLRSFPLLIDFFGLPYIDVRVSFNSFLPKNLPNNLCDKLVEHYIKQLENQPNNHDKVEFEIVQSCYTFDIQERLSSMKRKGFSDSELSTLKEHLLALTNQIINPRSGLWLQDLHKIEKLKERQKKVLNGINSKEAQIYWLLEDCKRYGTLPFAGLARAGFIAVQLLNSMVNKSLLSQEQVDTFLNSLTTVSGQMSDDFNRMPLERFLNYYGHLRPGTYEITSPRYDSQTAKYFTNSTSSHASISHDDFKIDKDTYIRLNEAIQEHNLSHSVDSLFHFIRSAIEGREYAKFIFSKSLSDALEIFAELGIEYGYSREALSFANINVIYNAYASADDFATLLHNSISEGQKRYELAQQIHLPPLITDLCDFDYFKSPELQPNFITQKTILADIVSGDLTQHDLTGKIVMIKSADPGYDWIFAHNIAGFITAYGGCNSHMAIRANEMGIPAVIGIGEERFNDLCKSNKIEISCASEQLRTIQ